MYFDDAEGPVFRPPSEANSFILRVTIGCSHNKCTYCNMYRTVKFRARPIDEILRQIKRAMPYRDYIRRIFLADGNALTLSTERLLEILDLLKRNFPKLQRVSSYGGPLDILRKTSDDLAALYDAGLKLVYYGMESGDDATLAHINKGVTAAQSIEAGKRITASPIKLSLMIILGLGGKPGSLLHAINTAGAVSQIRPHMLSALTLMMYRGSELLEEFERGEFELMSPAEIMAELHQMISNINLPPESHCLFRSNHISNYVTLAGTFPRDKEKLLLEINQAYRKLKDMTDWDPYNNVESF